MPVIDYGDVLYMHASSPCLHSLGTVYHGALRCITNLQALIHHCFLYARVGLTALPIRRRNHGHVLIYKAILNVLPSYLCTLIHQKNPGSYHLRSVTFAQGLLLLKKKNRTGNNEQRTHKKEVRVFLSAGDTGTPEM